MRHRPKRENYPNGTYGEMDYQEYLERYCTYLENKNKALTKQCNIADVVLSEERAECEHDWIERCKQGVEYIECVKCKRKYWGSEH